MKMKISLFLGMFFLISTIFFVLPSPIFASQPNQKCIKTRWFTICIPIPPTPKPLPRPTIRPFPSLIPTITPTSIPTPTPTLIPTLTPTPSPIPLLVGAALGSYTPPTGQDCDLTVPAQFSTIQFAVDAAVSGNTICVEEGTYNENVSINKSVRLSGSGYEKSIINGQGSDWQGAVYVTAENVIIEGFHIRGAEGNIAVQLDVNNLPVGATIQHNWLSSGNGGMALQVNRFQNNSVIKNNVLEGNNSPYVARELGSTGKVDFLNNTFKGSVNPNDRSDTGITLDAGVPDSLIKQNSFNTTGNMVALIAPSGTSIINENNFNSSVTLKVANGNPTTVNAENNYWGDSDPSDNIQGSVDFIPFATSPFAEN